MKASFKILDSDLHVMEPSALWSEYLDPRFRDRVAMAPDGSQGRWLIDGKILPPFADDSRRRRAWEIRAANGRLRRQTDPSPVPGVAGPGLGTRPDLMLKAMEIEGIDVAVIFRSQASFAVNIDGLDPELAAACCRACNRWIADLCSEAQERLKLAALVPLQDETLAIQEATYAVRDLGAATLVLPSHPINGRPLYDKDYDSLWETAQALDVTVSFHGNHAAYGDHLARRYLDNLVMSHVVGQPVELMLALGSVLTGGVLSRFPRLRMAFLEGNVSWLPWWLWALDERWEAWGDKELFSQRELPSELFLRQCYMSIEPEEELAKYVIAELGNDNFVLSTDWPHDDSRFPNAIDTFLAMEHLSDESKRKVLWDNCARLYNFS